MNCKSPHRKIAVAPVRGQYLLGNSAPKDVDEHNCYVERFDTLDGVHWEISVDIEQKIIDGLDRENDKLL